MRKYQQQIISKVVSREKSLFYLLWSARAGKDLTCLFILVFSALSTPGRVFGYFLPTKEIARRVIFDGRTDGGNRLIDMIPKDQIAKVDMSKMLITLINGSKIQFLCSDKNRGDSAAGETWSGVVVSEFALMQHGDSLLKVLRPRIAKDGGFLVINTTPRGSLGASYTLWEEAVRSDSWFCSKVIMTDIYTNEFVDDYIKRVGLDQFSVRRELFCDFFAPIEGAIYGSMVDKFKILPVAIGEKDLIFGGMDLGFKRDATSWWVFTYMRGKFCFLDFGIVFGGNFGEILDDIIAQYPNITLFLPHDADRGGGCSAIDRVYERKIEAYVIPRTNSVENDIKSIIKPLMKTYEFIFNDCETIKSGLEYLKMYRRNPNTSAIYHGTDGASDAADAFRYAVCGVYYYLLST